MTSRRTTATTFLRGSHTSSRAATRTLARCALIACFCACSSPAAEPVETPEKQFILRGLRIEEVLANGTRWYGTARRSEGDLATSVLDDPELTVTTPAPQERRYILRSPRGELNFDGHRASFTDVTVEDEGGGKLVAGRADYAGDTGALSASGPLRFTTPELHADAPRATIDMSSGVVTVEGPVTGRYEPVTPPPHAPRSP